MLYLGGQSASAVARRRYAIWMHRPQRRRQRARAGRRHTTGTVRAAFGSDGKTRASGRIPHRRYMQHRRQPQLSGTPQAGTAGVHPPRQMVPARYAGCTLSEKAQDCQGAPEATLDESQERTRSHANADAGAIRVGAGQELRAASVGFGEHRHVGLLRVWVRYLSRCDAPLLFPAQESDDAHDLLHAHRGAERSHRSA